VSALGDLTAKFTAFGWHVDRCDGHDMQALNAAFRRLEKVSHLPRVLIADTVKGKGVRFMEPAAMDPVERLYRFHSGAPNDDVYAKAAAELIDQATECVRRLGISPLVLAKTERPAVPAPGRAERLVTAYSRALVAQAERNPRLVALDADLVLDCGLIPFRQRFPERFFECGIAEQDMVSQAGGMALRGLLPVAHSFACFLSTRPNEQIYNNATEHTKIIYVASLAGLLPAGPGHSHQSVRDISALAGVPGLLLVEPSTEAEVEMLLDFCVNVATTSCYIRLVSVPAEIPYELPPDYRLQPGRGVFVRAGSDALVIAAGPIMLSQAFRAAEQIAAGTGVEVAIVNLPWLNQVDAEWLEGLARRFPWIITVDNHYVNAGQGQMVGARLAELALRPLPKFRRLGLTRIPLCGGNTEVLRAHHLDADSLAAEIRTTLRIESA
jgi:transketolase